MICYSPSNKTSLVFGLLALLSTFTYSSSCEANLVLYSITTEAVIDNETGGWGGDFRVGTGLTGNFTFNYFYNAFPDSIIGNRATFSLSEMQVIDNSFGRESGFISGIASSGSVSTLRINYDADMDHFLGASRGISGGFTIPGRFAKTQFGEVGDALPTGAQFDAFVEANGIFISGAVPGGRIVSTSNDAGEFLFSSSVPEPSSALMFSIPGMIIIYRRRRR